MEPFAKYPILRTDNAGEAEAALYQSLAEARILKIDNRQDFTMSMNSVSIGRNSFIYNRYETDTKISSRLSQESIYLIIGSSPPSTFKIKGKLYLTLPEEGIIISNERQITIDRPSNSEIVVLRVARTDLLQHFERLINHYNREHLSFDRIVNLNSGSGAMLKRLINHLAFELHNDDLILKDQNLRKSYGDMILTAMLSLPHNLREKLHSDRQSQVAPAVVYRSEEYMMAHVAEPITISDLLKVCNCSRSALFGAFQKTRDYSPMEFIAEQRLQNTRKELLKPNSSISISSIAQDHGFRNLGRFSQMYKRRFGENPSETLQRVRRR